MRIGSKRLPLNALHAFEAAGRHLNMGQAAAELSVTQSAISHQVRNLEEQLEVQLFDRSRKQLALTAAGQRLLAVASSALEEIKRGAISLDQVAFTGKFTIAAPPAFTNLWLVPRVGELLQRFPDLELHFTHMPARRPKVLPEADFVVQFGKYEWPRKRVAALTATDYLPVCSPRLLGRVGDISPASLAEQILIHDDDGDAWRQWLILVGLENLQPARHIHVSNAIDALELARSGVGFAINDNIITSNWLSRGELLAPFKQAVPAYDSFYVVTSPEHEMAGVIGEFESWLRQKIS